MTAVIIAALTLVAGLVGAVLQREPSAKRQLDVMLRELEVLRTMRSDDAPKGAVQALERAHLDRAERYAGPRLTPTVAMRVVSRRIAIGTTAAAAGVTLLALGNSDLVSGPAWVGPAFRNVGAAVYALGIVLLALSMTTLRSVRRAVQRERERRARGSRPGG